MSGIGGGRGLMYLMFYEDGAEAVKELEGSDDFALD